MNVVVPSSGLAGGILLFWRKQIGLHVLSYTNQAIHVQVNELHRSWLLSGVYVQPHFHLKEEFWEELRAWSQHINLPWVVIGDFNDIAYNG